jgi:hypothetical protein
MGPRDYDRGTWQYRPRLRLGWVMWLTLGGTQHGGSGLVPMLPANG